jgi:hypothetical protein
VGLRVAGFNQRVEVAAYTRRRQAQLAADPAGCGGPGFHQESNDRASGMTVLSVRRGVGHAWGLRTDFHNTSVTQFLERSYPGHP